MGTRAELILVGAPRSLLARGRARLAELEERWSRFRPDSETSALNRSGGRPMAVSPETFTLVALAVVGWLASGGRFDPTVLDALELAGYDRSFERLDAAGTGPEALPHAGPGTLPNAEPEAVPHAEPRALGQAGPRAVPPAGPAAGGGLGGVVLDGDAGTVALPPGTRFDPGGIGKGYAADLLCGELRTAGAAGVCVNLGGDLRVSGRSPSGGRWSVGVPHPRDGVAGVLGIADGAIATSSPSRRAWWVERRRRHHLIDPRSGQPADTDLLQVTAIASEGWRAEVAAKAAYLAGLAGAFGQAAGLGAEALVIDRDGRAHTSAGLHQPGKPRTGCRGRLRLAP